MKEIDFDRLVDAGWSFGFLDVEDDYALRPKLREVEDLPGSYAIVLDEIGTPSFKWESSPRPSSYFATRAVHPEHGEIFIFANPNDEGYILARVPIPILLEARSR